MLDPQIRPAIDSDAQAIEEIQQVSTHAAQWSVGAYLALDCRVAEIDGRVVGFIVLRHTHPLESEVINLAVHPDSRRQGIAEKLIRTACSHPNHDYFLEVRESNSEARRLYSRVGFIDVGMRPTYYHDPVEAGIVMRLQS